MFFRSAMDMTSCHETAVWIWRHETAVWVWRHEIAVWWWRHTDHEDISGYFDLLFQGWCLRWRGVAAGCAVWLLTDLSCLEFFRCRSFMTQWFRHGTGWGAVWCMMSPWPGDCCVTCLPALLLLGGDFTCLTEVIVYTALDLISSRSWGCRDLRHRDFVLFSLYIFLGFWLLWRSEEVMTSRSDAVEWRHDGSYMNPPKFYFVSGC